MAAVDSCVAPIGAHQHGAAARSISGQTRESKTRWPYFSRFFLLSWKGPKQLKLLDFFHNCFLHFQKFLKEKKQTVNCREVKISTVSRKCLNPIEIASQELVSAQYMAPAWKRTFSPQGNPFHPLLPYKFMLRLVNHLCFYTIGVVTPPLSMGLANYKYFQIIIAI